MINPLKAPAFAGMLLALAAGAASAAPAPPPPLAIPSPRYTTLVLELDVARPAAEVWGRVGKDCDIAEWLRTTCAITSGEENRLGAVRYLGLGSGVTEMMVARTALSYTYAQPVRVGLPYNAYHGTLEARPLTPTTTRLIYSFFYDVSMLADDAARATEIANRRARFMIALQNMKALAEGRPLPPAP
jgi:hypothetical protein